jgi:glutathione S-transferase/RNA polymerase-associated protein
LADDVSEAAAKLSVFDGSEDLLKTGYKRQYRDHRLEWMIRAGGLQVVVDGVAKGNIRFNAPGRFVS